MNARGRRYESPLRREQSQATRRRILEGLIHVIAYDGIGDLSIPAVAEAAQVSVPTVYRHFGSKQGLIEAMGAYVAEQAGLFWSEETRPGNVDELVDMVTELYRRVDAMDPALRAAMATNVGHEARKAQMPRRLKVIEQVLAPLVGDLPPDDFKRLRDVVLILGSSAAQRAFKDYLGLNAEQASETAAWAIRTLIETGESK